MRILMLLNIYMNVANHFLCASMFSETLFTIGKRPSLHLASVIMLAGVTLVSLFFIFAPCIRLS